MPDKLKDPRFLVTMIVIFTAGIYDFSCTFFTLRLDKELVSVILAALNANGLVVATSYWLGSSASSQEKNEQISALTMKQIGNGNASVGTNSH